MGKRRCRANAEGTFLEMIVKRLDGQDQLTVTDVLAQFESDLRSKGMANLSRLDATERAGALVEQYIRFPRGLKPES